VVGAVSIGSFELSRWRLRRTRWAMGFQSVRAGWSASLKRATETKGETALFLNIASEVLACDRKGGFWGTPSVRAQTRAWRAGTHLQQTLIETGWYPCGTHHGWLISAAAIAASRTRFWLASGWGCHRRRFLTEWVRTLPLDASTSESP